MSSLFRCSQTRTLHHDTARYLQMSPDSLKHTQYTMMQLDASRCLQMLSNTTNTTMMQLYAARCLQMLSNTPNTP